MSRFLYKYMTLRADFFNNPMIRATPVLALNDPFEGYFNKTQVRDADRNQAEYYKSQNKSVHENDESMLDEVAGVIQSDLFDLGILSFTEDYNNPLMWAHYADEHKGVVVEFDFNEPFFMDSLKEINGRKSRFGKSYIADFFEFPEKVNYRREMPTFERPELSAPESMNEFHWDKFNHTILFTKANDWIYEKEQRSIVRLKDADSIICKDCSLIREQCALDSDIKLIALENNLIQIIYPNEYEMHEDMGDESIKDEIHLLSSNLNEPPIHLFRINPSAISGIYFGCKSNESIALENIANNEFLNHITNINKMERNEMHYQFYPTKLKRKFSGENDLGVINQYKTEKYADAN